jgi:hypothetical protein
MRVDIANTGAAQVSVLYQREHLHRTRNHGLREAVETREKKFEILHLAQRNFADHKRMDQHHLAFEMPHEVVIGAPDMIDPNGAIDQQHQSFVNLGGRRRGGAFARGSLPPRPRTKA